jgi:hypothetical protein
MDRQITYPGQILPETTLLNMTKDAMIGLGMAFRAILGTSTFFDGLACTPTGPASLQVLVGPGSVYALENIDSTAFSSLGSDTTHQIVKQGINLGTLTLNCPAPGTTGQSINYLIQSAYQDTDTGATVLPYYNSSNPSVAYNGPANSGTSQNTVRQGQCLVAVKAGVAATTGSQTTPAPDAGYTGLWVVTVANGQTTIVSGNIAQVNGAPFISEKLGDKISIATGDARYLTSAAGLMAKSANLSDVTSLATALTNLGFASDSATYFKIPNPNNTSKPWIVQIGSVTTTANVTVAPFAEVYPTITFPITFPNACLALITSAVVNLNACEYFNHNSATTTGFGGTLGYYGSTGTSVTGEYIAIGN